MISGLSGSGRLAWAFGLGLGLAMGFVLGAALLVGLGIGLERRARGRWIDRAGELGATPKPELIVVLGCPPRTRSGRPSRYLAGRARAAADAYHALRTVPILCSGLGARPDAGAGAAELDRTDEIEALVALLEAAGIPREAMRFDRAARRTFDTIDHLVAHHPRERLLLVTQPFHLPRTLLLARARGLDAFGLAAPGPTPGSRVRLREALGQLRAVWDIAVVRRAR